MAAHCKAPKSCPPRPPCPCPPTFSWPSCPSHLAAWRGACASLSRCGAAEGALCWHFGPVSTVPHGVLSALCFPCQLSRLLAQPGPACTSQPSSSPCFVCHTMQGEMVQAKFGVPSVAVRQLEVFSNAVLTATLQVGLVGLVGCSVGNFGVREGSWRSSALPCSPPRCRWGQLVVVGWC